MSKTKRLNFSDAWPHSKPVVDWTSGPGQLFAGDGGCNVGGVRFDAAAM
jgi:hypothetical protein